jgi:G:T-mismatch repair DNA endonuclease (very short patch repair protein)
VDIFTPEKRSEIMGRIRGKDTKLLSTSNQLPDPLVYY